MNNKILKQFIEKNNFNFQASIADNGEEKKISIYQVERSGPMVEVIKVLIKLIV